MGLNFSKMFTRSKQDNKPEKRSVIDSIVNNVNALNCDGSLNYNQRSSYIGDKYALRLSAVYRCVEVISDSVAQLPLQTFKYDENGYKVRQQDLGIYKILNYTPNDRMSRYQFIKIMVTSMLLNGAGYAYIERRAGEVKAIHFIPYGYVTINDNDYLKEPTYTIGMKGLNKTVSAKDMICLVNFSYDGVHGISTLRYAANVLGIASDAESNAAGFFKGGANLAGILTVQGSPTKEQLTKIKQDFEKSFSGSEGNPNGVAVLQGNMTYQAVQVNPADSLLLESRQFDVIEICRYFGVSPVKCFDLSKSSYSTIEATQLSFLTDTLGPIISKIEQELNRKLFDNSVMGCSFDTSVILRTDKNSLASYYLKLFLIGAVTINDVRRVLDLDQIEGGDTSFVAANLLTLDRAVNGTYEPVAATEEKNNTEE